MFARKKEQRNIIHYLVAEKGWFDEMCRVMTAVYREHSLSLTHVQDGNQLFREGFC